MPGHVLFIRFVLITALTSALSAAAVDEVTSILFDLCYGNQCRQYQDNDAP